MSAELAGLDAPAEMKNTVAACVAWSNNNTIMTPVQLEATGVHLKDIKAAQKQANEFFDPPIKQAYDLHKMLVGRKKVITDPLSQAEGIDKQKMLTYSQEQERLRLAEQQRLQDEANAEAERQRKALEKKAAESKKPETIAKHQQAAAQVTAPVIHVAPVAQKIAGVATVKTWTFEIIDPVQVPDAYKLIDEVKLGKYARAMGATASVPGVRFCQKETISAGSR